MSFRKAHCRSCSSFINFSQFNWMKSSLFLEQGSTLFRFLGIRISSVSIHREFGCSFLAGPSFLALLGGRWLSWLLLLSWIGWKLQIEQHGQVLESTFSNCLCVFVKLNIRWLMRGSVFNSLLLYAIYAKEAGWRLRLSGRRRRGQSIRSVMGKIRNSVGKRWRCDPAPLVGVWTGTLIIMFSNFGHCFWQVMSCHVATTESLRGE